MNELNPDVVVDRIVSLEHVLEKDFGRILDQVAVLIDYSGRTKNVEALHRAIDVCKMFLQRDISSEHRAILYLFHC